MISGIDLLEGKEIDQKAKSDTSGSEGIQGLGRADFPATPYDDLIESASKEHRVPYEILYRNLKQESGFNPRAVSKTGAKGIAQFISSTAEAMGVKDPYDPKQAIPGSAKYIRQLYDQFGDWKLAIAAYNAGPNKVKEFGNRIPNIDETQKHVRAVFPDYKEGEISVDPKDMKRVRSGLELLDEPLFDPEGTGYDMETAKAAGLKADETGHWPSRDPRTGMLLKGRKHETWHLTEKSEEEAGYRIIKRDGRYYSIPKDEQLRSVSPTEAVPRKVDINYYKQEVSKILPKLKPAGTVIDEFGNLTTPEEFEKPQAKRPEGESISTETQQSSLIKRGMDSVAKFLGKEVATNISPAAGAQAVVQVMAKEAGVPLSEFRQSPELIEQAASSFVNTATFGIVPAIREAVTGEVDYRATDLPGYVGHAIGSLGGLIISPFAVSKAAMSPALKWLPQTSQEMKIGHRILVEALHDAAVLAPGMGLAALGEASKNVTFSQAAGKLVDEVKSGAMVGAIFGTARGLFPKEGLEQGVRIISGLTILNAYRATEVGGNPFTNRPVGEVLFDIAMDGFFLWRGLPRNARERMIAEIEDINKSYEDIKTKAQAVQNVPDETIRKIAEKELEVERTRLNNKVGKFVNSVGGDIAIAEEFMRVQEDTAKAKLRPVVESRPEMRETKAETKAKEAAEKPKKPVTKNEWNEAVNREPLLMGKVRIDAIGEEGTTLKPGHVQVTVIEKGRETSFTAKAEMGDVVDKYNKKMAEYDKAEENKNRKPIVEKKKAKVEDEFVKKINELDEFDKPMTEAQKLAIDNMIEDIEAGAKESVKPIKKRKVVKEPKPEPITEIDQATGTKVLELEGDTALFLQPLEKAEVLAKLYEERGEKIMEDPELYTQKLLTDASLWAHGKDVDINAVREQLKIFATRGGELRHFFDSGADHLQWHETVKEASKWASNLSRKTIGGGTRLNMMIPVDKIPETVKQALRYVSGAIKTVRASEIYRDKTLFDMTGYWLGRDGKFRYELDDTKLEVDLNKFIFDKTIKRPLPEVVNHPEMYKAVPELANTKIVIDPSIRSDARYSATDDLIRVKSINVKNIAHEIQHAINAKTKSKFIGTNVLGETVKVVVKELNDLKQLTNRSSERIQIDKLINDLISNGSMSIQDVRPVENVIKKKWSSVNDFAKVLSQKGFEVYKTDPGEIEARLTEHRFNMTAKQRAAEPPWVTLDKMLAKEGRPLSAGYKLYSGVPIDEGLKAIIAGAKKVREYTAQARGMKKFNPKRAAAVLRAEFNKAFVDRSGNIRNELLDKLGSEGYEIVQKMYLAKGASSISSNMLRQMRKEVYDGLSRHEKQILDNVILSDRMIDIAKYKGPSEFKFPKDIKIKDFIAYRELFREIEKLTPEQAERINSRAQAYFEWMKRPLKDMLDSGLISQEEFDNLSKHNYRRIKLVDIYDKRYTVKVGKSTRSVSDSGVESLARGRDTDIYEPSSQIMALEVFNRAYGRIMNNEANKALLELAKNNPENDFVRIKQTRDDKIPSGWNRIFVFDEGKKKTLYISPEMSKEWIVKDPEMSYRLGQFIRYASGSPVLRTMATGINWGFALANLPRDIMHANFTARQFVDGKWKSVYSPHLPIFSMQMGADLARVFIDAALRRGRYQSYIDQGGGMEFLTHQGRLFQRGRHLEGGLDKVMNFLGYFGETSEVLTRLAIRDRVIRNKAKEKGISFEEALKNKDITREATFAARDYMDFGQGGGIAKALDNAVPYLNAGIQGTRGLFRAFKPGSGTALSSTYKLAQWAALTTGIYIAAKAMSPNTMKELEGDIATVNNLVIPLGDSFEFVDEKGETRYPYIKIPIDPGQKFFKVFFEASADKWLGNEVDIDRVSDALKNLLPADVSTLPPSVSATLGYVTNKDFWRNEDIWKKTDKPFSWPNSREEYTEQTPQFYKDVGKVTGLSPERTKFAVEELLTNGTVFSLLLGQGYDAAFGDMPKSNKEMHLAQVLAKTPIISRFIGVTNPYTKHKSKINTEEERSVLKKFVENRGMDILVQGHLYDDNVSMDEVIKYASSFNDKDTYDRLMDRYKWELFIKNVPNKSFWRRMKGLNNDAKVKIFADMLSKSNGEESAKLWGELAMIKAAGGVISDDFIKDVMIEMNK